jgi:hypothetical protein
MRKRGKRRTSLRVTDKQEVEERKDADMALSSISFNKEKEEKKQKKDTYFPAHTRKEEVEKGFYNKKLITNSL